MRKIAIFCSTLVVIILTCAATAQETLAPSGGPRHTLVADGKAKAAIVLPREPDKLETYAANELRKYVQAITGCQLPIVHEPQRPDGYGIWLGRTKAAESAHFALSQEKLGRDGYAAQADAQGIIIVGRCPLGTLLGTYDIIEREFGVRWCEPDEKLGEVVPSAQTLSVGTFQREFKPSFDYRWVGDGNWALKQRMNVQVSLDGRPLGVNWKWHFHSFGILIPPQKYFDQHPEWFSLVNGKRLKSQQACRDGQLCTSNPEVVDKLAERLLETLDANPSIEIISLSPNDGGGFCECANCTALDEPGRGWFGRYSKRLAILNQEIARRVAKRYPKVRIKVGAYAMYALAPEIKDYRPEPNLIIQLCHIYFCHNHPIAGDKCKTPETYQPGPEFLPNQEFRRLVQHWSGLTDNLFIYEYYSLGGWSQSRMLWPMVHTMRQDIPWYRRMGAKGFYTQVGPWTGAPLNYYVAAKLAWNSDLDVDWLITDFCQKFFTSAARPMELYLCQIEEAMVRSDKCISYGLHDSRANILGRKIFDPPTRKKLRGLLDKAQRLAEDDTVRLRISAVRSGFEQCEAALLDSK